MSKQSTVQTQRAATPAIITPTPGLVLQRACACGQHTGGGECPSCQQKSATLQRAAINATSANDRVPPIVNDVLRGAGQPLDASARNYLEPRFGQDFSHVRVHTDSQAAQAAQAVNALAYTVGPNVVFGSGQYKPETVAGKFLLAHELTHVVQQSHANTTLQPLSVGSSHDAAEQEANLNAHAIVSHNKAGSNIKTSTSANPVLRKFDVSERNEITNLDAVVETARSIADDKGAAYMMRWGRFEAGTGGRGAWEKWNGTKRGQGSRGEILPNRYVFTCRCGMVDMLHFYQLMYIAIAPGQGGNRGATDMGREHELKSEPNSRFGAEDTPSNALGAFFGSEQSTFERQSKFVSNLRTFLERCRPIDFKALPTAEQDTIANYYGSRTSKNEPANQNETATPVVLPITACGGPLRTLPFTLDPADPQHKTIDDYATDPPPVPAPAPKPAPPPGPKPEQKLTLDPPTQPPNRSTPAGLPARILFDFDKPDLKFEAGLELMLVAQHLKSHPDVKVRIVGHTDQVGTPSYNLSLGQKRADNVAKELLKQGVRPNQILVTTSLGSTQPISNHNPKLIELDRRVEITQ